MVKKYKHIFIKGNVQSEKYKSKSGRGETLNIPSRDNNHAARILKKFENIREENKNLKLKRDTQKIKTKEGTYLSFYSATGYDLKTQSLENLKEGIRLLNITKTVDGRIRATVYIPKGKENYFIKKIRKYQQEDRKKNALLVESIEDISLALLEGLWIDNEKSIPDKNAKWCEVWLRIDHQKIDSKKYLLDKFFVTLKNIGIEVKKMK